ncbi:MAG: type II toxin-antitoxin system VapC family toxin [Candidatus Micrarchaeia archaeon]
MKVYLDANFFVFAGFDATEKGNQARKILEQIVLGKKQATTSALCLDEVMWTLLKNKAKQKIRSHLEDTYSIPNLKIVSGTSLSPLRAVDFMEKYNLKPRDAFHAAIMQEQNLNTIISDDKDFDKIKEIKRIWK